MAETRKPKTTKSTRSKAKPKAAPKPAKSVEDAVVVEEVKAEDIAEASKPEMPDEPVAEVEAKPEPSDANASASKDAAEPETPETVETVEKVKPEPAVIPAPVLAEPAQKRGGALPLIFGGVIAACLGAGALYWADRQGLVNLGDTTALEAQIGAQTQDIAALQKALAKAQADIEAAQTPELDLGPVNADLDALRGANSDLASSVDQLGGQVSDLNARLSGLETQPIPKAELPAEVVAAYEAQLADMQARVDAQFDEMQTGLDAKLAEIATAGESAMQMQESAQAAADKAAARAALSQIENALASGGRFIEASAVIEEKTGLTLPAPLAITAAEGAPSTAELQAEFPALARAALTASTRALADEGSVDRVSAFFRTQLGARSLEPREGDDPDAILSRAEAAVRSDDISTALAEIAALPQAGQDVLADWSVKAQTRADALAAFAELSAQINSN